MAWAISSFADTRDLFHRSRSQFSTDQFSADRVTTGQVCRGIFAADATADAVSIVDGADHGRPDNDEPAAGAAKR